jgi:hypothetical protein
MLRAGQGDQSADITAPVCPQGFAKSITCYWNPLLAEKTGVGEPTPSFEWPPTSYTAMRIASAFDVTSVN